jgi:hypothetical protein
MSFLNRLVYPLPSRALISQPNTVVLRTTPRVARQDCQQAR